MQSRGLQRPSKGETEDDLLRAQKQMLGMGENEVPSATVIRTGPPTIRRSGLGDGTAMQANKSHAVKEVRRERDESRQSVRFDLENMEALESDGLGGEICGNAPTSPQPHVLPTPTKTGQGRADSKRTSAFARARMSRNATNTEGPQPATRAANVMAEVVERDIVAASAPVEPPQFRRSPYPIAQKRTPGIEKSIPSSQPQSGTNPKASSHTAPAKKKSLFALDFEKRRANAMGQGVVHSGSAANTMSGPSAATTSQSNASKSSVPLARAKTEFIKSLRNADCEDEEMHNQNVSTLAGLSPEELLEERQAIFEAIDPKVIAMLRAKKKMKDEKKKTGGVLKIAANEKPAQGAAMEAEQLEIENAIGATAADEAKKSAQLSDVIDGLYEDDSVEALNYPTAYVKPKTKRPQPKADDSVFEPKVLAAKVGPRKAYEAPEAEQVQRDINGPDSAERDRAKQDFSGPKVVEMVDEERENEEDGKARDKPVRKANAGVQTTSADGTVMTVLDIDDPLAQNVKFPLKVERDWVHMDRVEVEKLQWMQPQQQETGANQPQAIGQGAQQPVARPEVETAPEVPEPSKDMSNTKQYVRFDFNGHILPINVDIPSHFGLHHHGDEESRAGYSLNELVMLVRSSVANQRAMAWNTVTAILVQLRDGGYDEETLRVYREGKGDGTDDDRSYAHSHSAPEAALVLHAIKQLGLPYLLRMAVDEQGVSMQDASVRCLAVYLELNAKRLAERNEAMERRVIFKGQLQPNADSNSATAGNAHNTSGANTDSHTRVIGSKMTSDNVTSVGIMSDSELWQTSGSGTSACDARVHFRAHEYVAMDTGVAANDGMTENKQSDQDGKDTENPDERMVKRDPVRGYVLHMQLLPRLRYLLEVAAVPGLVEPILDILLAVGSHTPVMARQIVQCSRLVEYIHGEFVRVDRPADTGSKRLPYGTPHVKALRLMTVLAASSSDVCEHLHQEGVYSSMLRYAMYPFGEPTDEEDEHDSLLHCHLQFEAVQLWRVALSRGVYQYMYNDLSTVFLQQLTPLLAVLQSGTGAALPLPPARLQCLSGVFTLVQAACVNAIAAYHERAQTRADKEHTPSKGHTQGTEEPADEEDDVNTCQPQHVLGFLSPLLQLFNTITERFRLGPSAIRYVDLNFYGTLAHTTASLYHLYVLTHTPTPRPASPHTSPDANIHTMNGAHASTANSRSQHADSHTTLSSSTHHLLSRVLMGQYAAAVLAALSMPLTRALLCDDMHVHAHTRSADGARKHTHSESDLSSTASAKPTDTRPAQERSSATTPTTTATDTGADNGTVQPTYEDVVAEHSARRKQRDTAHVHDAAQAVRWNYLGALLRCGESLVRVRHGGVVSTREGVNADSTPETARETRACSGTGEEVNGHPDEDPDGGHDTGARKETAETGAGAVEDRLWQALAVGGGANAPNERATGQDSAAQYATPPDNPQACSSPQANTATCHQATGHAHTHTRAPSGSARISLCNALLWYDVLLRRTLSVKASSVRVRASRRHAVCTHLSLMTLLLAHRRRPYPLPSTHVAPSQLHSRYASQSRCACVGFCSRDYTTSLAVHRRAMALVGECGDLFTAEVVQTLSHVALSQDYLGVLTSRSSSCVPVCVRGQAEAKDWRGERKPDARDARVGAQGAAGLQGFDVVSKRVPWQVTDVIRAANAQLKGRATVGAANTSTCVNETPCTGAAQPSTCGGPDETPILGEGVELAGEGAGTWPEGLLGLYLQQIVPEVVEQERDSVHVRDVSSVAFLEMRYLACMYPRTYATHAHTPPNGNGAGGGATARAGAKKARNENAPEKRRLPLSNDWVLLPLMACYDHYIATEKASIRNHKHTSANTDMQHKGQRDIRGMSAGDAIEEESELTDAQTYAMVLEKTATLLLVTEYSHGSINSQIVQEGEAQTQVTRAQTQVQTKPKEEDGVTDATRVGVSVVNEYKLARLMTVFLTSAELFTSPAVAQLLETLLVLCVRQAKVENEMAGRGKGHVHLDFDCLPDIKFYDLYNAFVHQYSSVSLGNTLFQRYLWLPLQQCGPTPLRTLVWGQCVDAMAVMTNFTPDDLPLALETYLYPLETYTPLLTLYLRAIMSGTVRKSRAPVPYHIAIHHLAGLLWGSGDDTPIPDHVPEAPQTETEKMQNQLLTFMSTQRNQESVHDLLAYFYEGPSAFASTSYRPEPPQRVKMLEKFMKTYTKTAT